MIRILIAEDMPILRQALASLLKLESDFEVVAEVSCGDAIVSTALETNPDIALLDIDLPCQDGIIASACLRRKLPECRSIILTNIGNPTNLRRALKAGASGFLLKDTDPNQLANTIRSVASGGQIIDPGLAVATILGEDSPLSNRETEVLKLTASGEDIPSIARKLFLSAGTVRNYLAWTPCASPRSPDGCSGTPRCSALPPCAT